MNFNANVDVEIEEVFESMSPYDKKIMIKLLRDETEIEELVPFDENNQEVVKEKILKSIYREFGFGSIYLDKLIEGIQKIKQGEVPL